MAGNVKLMTSAGGGVILDTATTTATDVTVKVPVTGVNNGTLICSDSSGNVGIGTSSPQTKLDVQVANGYIRSGTNGSDTNFNIRSNSGSNCSLTLTEIGQADRWTIGCVAGQNYLAFRSNSSNMSNGDERMRIDSNGNLLVGATTAGLDTQTGFNVTYAGGSTYSTWGHVNGTGSGQPWIVFSYNGGPIGSIVQNGTTSTNFNTTSDYRLKENIQPMQNALAVVQQLNPVTYTWKADGSDGQGFIAHELQAVVPDCVTGEKDAVDAEGNPVYQGIDTSFLVATLTKAIQEQQAQIETLTAKVAALEAK